MSGIGSSELIILVLIGLIVLGPRRLPQIANQIGSWIGQARRMTRAMKRQLEDELNFDDDFNRFNMVWNKAEYQFSSFQHHESPIVMQNQYKITIATN